jgi:type I restriction enzyme S subunit
MSFPRYPEYNASGVEWLGDVPGHWCTKPLGSCFLEQRVKVSDTEFEPLSVTMNGIVPQLEHAAKTDDNDNRKKVCNGDYVINSRSDRKGSSGMATRDGSVSLINIVLKPLYSMKIEYVHHLLRSVNFQEEFYRFGKGIVADLWSTNYSSMKLIQLPIPPRTEQKAIADFLDRETAKIDGLIEEQRRLVELLKEKRQAVISHAVTKGLNPNAPMKPSGIEWLGDIPEHWEVKPLKHLADFISGGTPSKNNPCYWDGEVPWASSKDLKTEFLTDTLDHITLKALEEGAASLVPAGTVLVVVRGMILIHTFPVVQIEVSMAINQDLKAITAKPDLLQSYLPWLMRGTVKATNGLIDEAAHGTKVLRMESWTKLELPIPKINEQKSIVGFLSRTLPEFDSLISEAEKSITLLQERRTALISAAVTGKIDVRGLIQVESKS